MPSACMYLPWAELPTLAQRFFPCKGALSILSGYFGNEKGPLIWTLALSTGLRLPPQLPVPYVHARKAETLLSPQL